MRARIVPAVADGEGILAISRRLGVPRPTMIQWRDRYAAAGLSGLDDAKRWEIWAHQRGHMATVG